MVRNCASPSISSSSRASLNINSLPASAIHDVGPIQGSLDEDDEDFDGLDDALKDLESDELDSLDKEENKSVHEE